MNQRHSWVKPSEHVYICRLCGTGRVNAQTIRGEWFTTFHRPDGSRVVSPRVPSCEPGPRTAAYLKKYEAAIAIADALRADRKGADRVSA